MASIFNHPVKSLVRLGALGLLLAGLPGCQSIDNSNISTAASIRVIDASPDAPGLDIYQGTTAMVYNLGFGSVSSYVSLTPGTYTISADTSGSKQTLASSSQTLAANKHYTAVIGNVAASLQQTIYTDQSTAAPSGQISIRLIDQATNVGAVDVYLVSSTATLATSTAFLTNVNFGSNSGYINVPAGTYAIDVVPTGTVVSTTTVPLLTGSSVIYGAGAVRTVVLINQLVTTVPGVQAVVAVDYDSPNS